MGMAEQMKKKAIPGTSVNHSKKIIKKVNRAEVVELNRTLEPIIKQNHRELIASWEEEHDKTVGI